ncbi:MAG: hypothetical protein ABFC57_09655 [Veillonellales bacterium]
MGNAEKQKIQADVTKIKAAIASLQAEGADLFSEEILNLKQKLAANIENEAAAPETQVETKARTWTKKFREEHGISVPVAVAAGSYIIWQVAAAGCRALGWF